MLTYINPIWISAWVFTYGPIYRNSVEACKHSADGVDLLWVC